MSHRVADDFDAIRKAMVDRGLDGDNGATLRKQQEQATAIDRELECEYEITVFAPSGEKLAREQWNQWARWGFEKEKGTPRNDPDICNSWHNDDPSKKSDAWDAWNVGASAARRGFPSPPVSTR